MKYAIDLNSQSSTEWIEVVLNDFNTFLQDHADCERKASSMAMSFIAKAPERVEIIPELIETALEELEHFQQVYQIMEKRGIQLKKEMEPDLYVQRLINSCRSGREERYIDRMLLASVLECRGAERFKVITDAMKDPELKEFYHSLWTCEAKHGNIFVKMLLNYFPKEKVYPRLDELMELEAKILGELPVRAALH